jgi:formylmethanofuran dehydrogenase subunit D
LNNRFILITGRTRDQAKGLHSGGGGSVEHIKATAKVEMSPDDMKRLTIIEGDVVRVTSSSGTIEVPAYESDLPQGMIFIPMGPSANKLVGAETFGTGMPSFKEQVVEIIKL